MDEKNVNKIKEGKMNKGGRNNSPSSTRPNKAPEGQKRMISKGLVAYGFRPEEFKMLMDICKMTEMIAPREEADLIKKARTWKENFKLLWEKYGTQENQIEDD